MWWGLVDVKVVQDIWVPPVNIRAYYYNVQYWLVAAVICSTLTFVLREIYFFDALP